MTLNKAFSALRYKHLLSLFEKIKGYTYAHIKGETLSFQSYHCLGRRHVGDIDLLLPRAYLKKIEATLVECGFVLTNTSRSDRIMMYSASHQVAPWTKPFPPFGNIEIDLNFDIFWGEYTGKRVDIDEFLSNTVGMDIYGVKVKTLPPLKAMVQLILHHYKDMNSIFLLATRKSIKYDVFKDVYYLLKNNLDEISLDKMYKISAEYGIIPYVYYVLYHTGLLFYDETLREYISAFKTPEGEALLGCYGLNDSERHEWRYDFKTRLETDNLYELIKSDLTAKDEEKIAINRRAFLSE